MSLIVLAPNQQGRMLDALRSESRRAVIVEASLQRRTRADCEAVEKVE